MVTCSLKINKNKYAWPLRAPLSSAPIVMCVKYEKLRFVHNKRPVCIVQYQQGLLGHGVVWIRGLKFSGSNSAVFTQNFLT